MQTNPIVVAVHAEQQRLSHQIELLTTMLARYRDGLCPPGILRLLRQYADVTQEQLSLAIGVNRTTIVKLESGTCTNSKIYDLCIDYLSERISTT